MSPTLWFIFGLAVFLFLAFIGMPVAFAFGIVGFLGTVLLMGLDPGLALLGTAPWQWASNGGFIVVPLFILMGTFSFYSGISQALYVAAYKWLGRLPGGLAIATNLACTGFAACTGTSLASGATMGTIAFPEMRRFKYDNRLATGCIGAGGTLGILIPPSIFFIIYGFITQQPIGSLFIAGILPGLMLSAMFVALILVMCIRNPELGPRGESFSWKERLASLNGVWGVIALFILVIGGLYAGIFAPSEAGAIGAIGAFIIALSRRTAIPKLFQALIDSLKLTCMVLTITIGAMMFNIFVTISGVPTLFAEWISGLPVSPYMILIFILLMYIPLGMVMDVMAMILLTIPIIFPIITGLGFDPIWFGVLVVVMCELANITPPVGMTVYVVHGVTKVPLEQVFRGNLPFVIVMIVGLAILVAFPDISLFLVRLAG
ncbi:MAG: TRAP transporter large permease [Deltaproteobacteria bacterium]|nr:TRAP transporter large permease [Deltaproteobacteria bacterium]